MGIDIIAHLTCVGASEQSIDEFVSRLCETGVSDILALGGDGVKDANGEGQSRFFHASDLVEYVDDKFSEVGIAVADIPEVIRNHLPLPRILKSITPSYPRGGFHNDPAFLR